MRKLTHLLKLDRLSGEIDRATFPAYQMKSADLFLAFLLVSFSNNDGCLPLLGRECTKTWDNELRIRPSPENP